MIQLHSKSRIIITSRIEPSDAKFKRALLVCAEAIIQKRRAFKKFKEHSFKRGVRLKIIRLRFAVQSLVWYLCIKKMRKQLQVFKESDDSEDETTILRKTNKRTDQYG
jgi:hypothetical protein